MEKLGQLRRAEEWDLIVVDTPPSRSALDFLDAPQRLGRFLDGRLIRLLTAPAKVGGPGVPEGAQRRVRHVHRGAHQDARRPGAAATCRRSSPRWTRCSAGSASGRSTPTGCSRRRARRSWWSPRPEPDALREASYFVERLSQDRMPLAGLVLNRVHRPPAARLSAARSLAAAETLQATAGDGQQALTAMQGPARPSRVTRSPWRRCGCTPSGCSWRPPKRRLAEHFTAAHPSVPIAEIPAQPEDVHDLAGLRRIGEATPRRPLTGGRTTSSRPHQPGGFDRVLAARPDHARCGVAAAVSCGSAADARSPAARTVRALSRSRQDVTSGRRRSRARRSRSVMPPQTPNSIRLSRASARHSVRTGQPRQISLARFCAAPWTKSSSGSVPLHAARQSSP